jgi:hypothetical protein
MKEGVLVNKNTKINRMMGTGIAIGTQRNIKEVGRDKLPMMTGSRGIHGLINAQKALVKSPGMTISNHKATENITVGKRERTKTKEIAKITGIIVIIGI